MSGYLRESEGHPYRGNYCERMALPLDTSTTPGASLSDGVTEPRGKVLPLNSKRLKTVQLQRLARALSIPTSASGDELRQLIDGKLEGMERARKCASGNFGGGAWGGASVVVGR